MIKIACCGQTPSPTTTKKSLQILNTGLQVKGILRRKGPAVLIIISNFCSIPFRLSTPFLRNPATAYILLSTTAYKKALLLFLEKDHKS